MATATEDREKQSEDLVAQLSHQLREKEHEKVLIHQNLAEVQKQAQAFDEEKQYWKAEMIKLRDLVQSQNAVIKKEVVQEPTAIDMTFGLESDDESIPNHSSPCRPGRKINNISNISKGLPNSLGKLGMSVFNPAKSTKIEYLSKFVTLVEDFDTTEDF